MTDQLAHVLDFWTNRLKVPACLAGGYVRDTLTGREPKDVDVFAFVDFDVASAFDGLDAVEVPEWHKSEPFLQGTFRLGGKLHQVMRPEVASVTDLLDTFDWNVARFAYDGQVHAMMDHAEIRQGGWLELHRVTFPRSTLRRGYRFSERYGMRIKNEDVADICRAVLALETETVA